jgi:hypothetical protein
MGFAVDGDAATDDDDFDLAMADNHRLELVRHCL